MTGACVLCRAVISVEPDQILDAERNQRDYLRFCKAVCDHLVKFHDKEVLPFVAESGNMCNGITMLSYVETGDEFFARQIAAARERLTLATAQKQESMMIVEPGTR